MCASCTFVDQYLLTLQVAGQYDTTDSTLAAWEMTPAKNLVFNIFKITANVPETFSAVMGASPDQPFTLDASTKFRTNMDGVSAFAAYDKSRLVYTYTCNNPTTGSNTSLAAANNCCSLVFSWNGTVLTKLNPTFGKYCDGNYSVSLTAKNSAFPAYTQTFTATIAVKYDCLYLKNNA